MRPHGSKEVRALVLERLSGFADRQARRTARRAIANEELRLFMAAKGPDLPDAVLKRRAPRPAYAAEPTMPRSTTPLYRGK